MSTAQPTPPPPPALPSGITVRTAEGEQISIPVTGNSSAAEIYEGQVAARKEIRNQLDRAEETRDQIASNLKADDITSADRSGLEARLKQADDRIANIEQQLAAADAAVAKAAAAPGAIVPFVEPPRNGPPEEIFAIPIVFTIFVLMPIAIAYARRIWKRGSTVIAPVPREVMDRLDTMGQAVESIAIEVERIGEGQRFITKVMGDRQLGAGAAQPIVVGERERVEARAQ
jgi:hypothetical protein